MKKRVLLLAVSCKTGGLCPGGLDLDNPREWIRIVSDDGHAGAVQGYEIDFADPLDVIEFDGRPMPQGKQQENWVIDNHSCVNLGRSKRIGNGSDRELLDWAYNSYSYHGFWNNYRSFLNEQEFEIITAPSESILRVSNIRIYTDEYDKAKIDFEWNGLRYPIKWVSMTDQNFYSQIRDGNVITFENAYIVISIPKECWIDPFTGEGKAFKFVSKIFEI